MLWTNLNLLLTKHGQQTISVHMAGWKLPLVNFIWFLEHKLEDKERAIKTLQAERDELQVRLRDATNRTDDGDGGSGAGGVGPATELPERS